MHSSGFLLFSSILFTLLQRQIVFLLSKSTSNRKDAIILTFYTIPTERLTRWLRIIRQTTNWCHPPMEHRCQCDVVIASSSKSNHLRNSRQAGTLPEPGIAHQRSATPNFCIAKFIVKINRREQSKSRCPFLVPSFLHLPTDTYFHARLLALRSSSRDVDIHWWLSVCDTWSLNNTSCLQTNFTFCTHPYTHSEV